ncbi:MAG: rhodanese-like domain-containing protein [Clostridiales bacterium]|nr:rhodanese-like domain-containing protein [Clostridiales bacterium]
MFRLFKKEVNKVINVNDIDKLIGKVDLIDIRENFEYNRGSIKTAKNIPMDELLKNTDEYLEKNKEYYIVCQSGGRSSRACSSLRSKGYNVVNVSGGVGSYLGKYRE